MFEGKNREILMKKLETQIRLGTQHKNMSLDEMLLLRRSINTGSTIIDSVYNISFEKLVLALYIKTNDENFLHNYRKNAPTSKHLRRWWVEFRTVLRLLIS